MRKSVSMPILAALVAGFLLVSCGEEGRKKPSPAVDRGDALEKPAQPAPAADAEKPAAEAYAMATGEDGSPGPDVEPGQTATTEKRVYRFAFIPKGKHIPVFNYAKIGAERKAAELGNVVIFWDGPDSNDREKQKQILEGFIAEGVDGIAISALDAEMLRPVIDKAVAGGIPVVTWDSDVPKSKRAAFYGVDDFKAGVIMGQEIVKLLGDQGGEIAVLTTLGADNLTKRLEGALSVIHQHPRIKVVETFNVEDDSLTAARVIEDASKTYPNLRAWISMGGWPGFAMNMLDPVPQGVYVVTFDTIPPAPRMIKKGRIHLALGQKYFGWGTEPTQILFDIVANGKYPDAEFIDSGVDIVTPENVDEYLKKWDRMEKGN